MDAKARFNELRAELGLPLDQLAALVRRPYGTVKAWAAVGRVEMAPPNDILETLDATILQRAIERCRIAGYEVIPRYAHNPEGARAYPGAIGSGQ